MRNTTNFKFGQIVLVNFPFTHQRGGKQRPAIIVSSAAYNEARPDIILMAITSQIKIKEKFGEATIEDWQAAGLRKPSTIKPIVFTVEKKIVKKTLGQLSDKDQEGLMSVIKILIG